MQNQLEQSIAQINYNYQHYQTFRSAFEHSPIKLILMLKKYGSEGLKSSQYFNLTKMVNTISHINYFLYTCLASSVTVFALTFLLHTRRAWVLSTAGPLRSIILKYLPIWMLWSGMQYNSRPRISADAIQADFGQIQNQFMRIYDQHKFDSLWHLLL